MWHNNQTVNMTFCSAGSKNAWASIGSLGWKKIAPTTTDGVTNVYMMMCAARGNSQKVNVNFNAANEIDIAYLL